MDQLITVKGLNKSFSTPGGSFQVLNDIDFNLKKGEIAALMGPSGVGKSTLLHILGTLDRPTSGEILYSGENVFGLGNDDLSEFRNSTIGFVFQFHHLMPEFNAMENVAMPALISGLTLKQAGGKAEHLLEAVGLTERMLHKPGELSGGEQQRVAVARALMLDPKVVLADEPTGNLDTKTGDELMNLLLELNKTGISFIIVTHNDNLAEQCGRTVRMKDGRII